MKTYVPSGTSQELEVRLSVPVSKLLSGMVIEVPEGWEAVYSAKDRTLSIKPLGAVPLSVQVSDLVSEMSSKEI